MKKPNKTVKNVGYLTFIQKIDVDEGQFSILYNLSKTMIFLWNLAIFEAQKWLTTNIIIKEILKAGMSTDDLLSSVSYLISVSNSSESNSSERGITIVRKKTVTAFNFNYWLSDISSRTRISFENKYIRLSDINQDLCRQLLVLLAGSYQSYFELIKNGDTKAKKPRPKNLEEVGFQILTWSTAVLERNIIKLPVGNGERLEIHVPDRLLSQIFNKGIVYVSVFRKDNQFFLKVVVKNELPAMKENVNFIRAIDLGAGDVAVFDSDGSRFLIPARRSDKHWTPEIKQVRDRMAKCKKNSRAYNRRLKGFHNIHRKGENQRRDYQRKLAKALCEDKVDCIVVSKADTRLGLAQSEDGSKKQHSGVQQTGYMHRLLIFIKEAASKKGIIFIEEPDPKRVGSIDDPSSKFNAANTLLESVLKKFNIQPPNRSDIKDKKFSFVSSSGAGEYKGNREEKREFINTSVIEANKTPLKKHGKKVE